MKRNNWLIFAVFAGCALPTAAWAVNCDAVVDDRAGIFGSRVEAVREAAQRLENNGAEVRVLTMDDLGGAANLDQYKAEVQQYCASWRAADGGMKNNLIVFMVSVRERKSGLYYGDLWRRQLDSAWPAILADEVNPRFRDRNFAGGIASGFDAVNRLIDASRAPPVSTAPPVIVREQPTDLSGLWTVLEGLLLLVALTVAFIFIGLIKKSVDRKKAVRQKAQADMDACSALVVELDELTAAEQKRIELLATQVVEEDVTPLRLSLDGLLAAYRAANSAYLALRNGNLDPGRAGLSIGQLEHIAAEYAKTLGLLTAVKDGDTVVHRKLTDGLEKIVGDAPATVVEAERAAAEAIARVQKVTDQGFRTEAVKAELAETVRGLDEAKLAKDAKRFRVMQGKCREALTNAANAAELADGYPVRCQKLAAAVPVARDRIPAVHAAIVAGRANFLAIQAEHAESSWAEIRGNGTEAEKRLTAVPVALDQAATLSTMEMQDWDQAEKILAQAIAWLDECESFMRSIAALRQHLTKLKAEVRPEIEAAKADLAKATEFMKAHQADMDGSREGEVVLAREGIANAERCLAEPKPDYPAAAKQAAAANKLADELLVEVRSDYEVAERRRQEAATALREAEASYSKASEYIQDHYTDTGKKANELLATAERELKEARAEQSLALIVVTAQMAEKSADEALNQAKKDVRREQERSSASSYSGGSSSSDSFLSGLAGGMIGSSWGSGTSGSSWGGSRGGSSRSSGSSWGGSGGLGGGGSSGWGGSHGGGGSSGGGRSSSGGGGSSGW